MVDPAARCPIGPAPIDRHYAPPIDLQSIGIGLRPQEQAGSSVLNPGASMNGWQMNGGRARFLVASAPPVTQAIPSLYYGPVPMPGQER